MYLKCDMHSFSFTDFSLKFNDCLRMKQIFFLNFSQIIFAYHFYWFPNQFFVFFSTHFSIFIRTQISVYFLDMKGDGSVCTDYILKLVCDHVSQFTLTLLFHNTLETFFNVPALPSAAIPKYSFSVFIFRLSTTCITMHRTKSMWKAVKSE